MLPCKCIRAAAPNFCILAKHCIFAAFKWTYYVNFHSSNIIIIYLISWLFFEDHNLHSRYLAIQAVVVVMADLHRALPHKVKVLEVPGGALGRLEDCPEYSWAKEGLWLTCVHVRVHTMFWEASLPSNSSSIPTPALAVVLCRLMERLGHTSNRRDNSENIVIVKLHWMTDALILKVASFISECEYCE